MSSFEKSLLYHLETVDSMATAWNKGLRSEVFEDPTNQAVYEFCIRYWFEAGMKEVPPVTVLEVEFPAYVPESGPESLTWLITELQKRYVRNTMQDMLIGVAEQLEGDPHKALDVLYTRSWETKEIVVPRVNRSDMSVNVEQRRLRYEAKLESGELGQGLTFGLEEVDIHTGGLKPGELGIVVAYTKVGKSFFLINAAKRAKRKGFTPVIFSLEQTVEEFEDRMDCFYSGVGYGKMMRGELGPDEYRRLMDAQDEMAALGPLHVEQPVRGERTVAALANRCRQLGGDYLIIDQLSHMDVRPKKYRQDTTEKHAEIIFDLKDEITAGDKLPCFMAVQYNRQQAAGTKSGERGQLSQIANSADIERTVDIALGLSRTREQRSNHVMVLDVLGARRSDTQSWLLSWHLNNRTEISVIQPYEETS